MLKAVSSILDVFDKLYRHLMIFDFLLTVEVKLLQIF